MSGPGFRVTVLTSRLLRLEWNDDDRFVDDPTPMVVNRTFEVPEFRVADDGEVLQLWTEHLHLSYDRQPFSGPGLSVSLRTRADGSHRNTWHFGHLPPEHPMTPGNLGGTARTLDEVDGSCRLDDGLLATYGFAVVDDSASVRLTPDGWFAPRARGTNPNQDLYFFGYGTDYPAALHDYFVLTGPNPLVPRYTLGNWWSRYFPYSEEGYLELMDRFEAERIPLSVAVLDMDWHLVDIDPSLGSGWTGYTWNRQLFPDPPAFLQNLHERGMAVSLNVHPADGVRRHEDAYRLVAQDMGADPDTGAAIAFDVTSRRFVESYLERLHHPLEDEGVDFWWLDWQSGAISRVPGLDPLWMLNHVHFQDSGREGRRPLTFSRYAGLGSHRYPVGFSGDTIISWASLDFQPYFTATAANVGYFWWSHDVGGHMLGGKDDELAARWYQLGAFSPINRLHSGSNLFNSKEPWRFDAQAERVMSRFLRLRSLLTPYLYTAAWRAHTDGVGVVRPMYHDHPGRPEALRVPNEYMFGTDLLVAPITSPADTATRLGSVRAWLPDGVWYDFFTGRAYDGGRELALHRPLESMPVLARAGAIVPLLTDPMIDVGRSPEALQLRIFPGADGRTVILEDDGRAQPSPADRQETEVRVSWECQDDGSENVTVTVDPPRGDGVLTTRDLTLDLVGVRSVAEVVVNGVTDTAPRPAAGTVTQAETPIVPGALVALGSRSLADGLQVVLRGVRRAEPDTAQEVFALVDAVRAEFQTKERAYALATGLGPAEAAAALTLLELPGNLYGALLEVLTARSA